MTTTHYTCQTCLYRDTNGFCRKLPPQVVLCPTDDQHSIFYYPGTCWPQVADTDWCGAYLAEAQP